MPPAQFALLAGHAYQWEAGSAMQSFLYQQTCLG